jgi:N-hydroxyarylamine O-acetyltransferase
MAAGLPGIIMAFDLNAYFERIGYGGPARADAATLQAVHEAQVGAIPFENIDVLLGRPLDLSHEGIARKLVTARRGGYCYEQNLLLLAALRAIGFEVTALAARVRMGYGGPRPRTHALLRVSADGADWVADAGFGLSGLLAPVPLRAGAEVTLPLVSFRVADEDGLFLMQARKDEGDWENLYVFSLEPQHEVDFVMANHFTATWPRSPFIRSLIVGRVTRDRRLTLIDRDLSETTAAGIARREMGGAEELFAALERDFGLAVDDPAIAERAFAEKEAWG